jgi:hypothetical protein
MFLGKHKRGISSLLESLGQSVKRRKLLTITIVILQPGIHGGRPLLRDCARSKRNAGLFPICTRN